MRDFVMLYLTLLVIMLGLSPVGSKPGDLLRRFSFNGKETVNKNSFVEVPDPPVAERPSSTEEHETTQKIVQKKAEDAEQRKKLTTISFFPKLDESRKQPFGRIGGSITTLSATFKAEYKVFKAPIYDNPLYLNKVKFIVHVE